MYTERMSKIWILGKPRAGERNSEGRRGQSRADSGQREPRKQGHGPTHQGPAACSY